MNGTKSALASKINWTAMIGAVASLGLVFGWDIDPDLQAKLAASLTAVTSAAVIVWRTWFTSKAIK